MNKKWKVIGFAGLALAGLVVAGAVSGGGGGGSDHSDNLGGPQADVFAAPQDPIMASIDKALGRESNDSVAARPAPASNAGTTASIAAAPPCGGRWLQGGAE